MVDHLEMLTENQRLREEEQEHTLDSVCFHLFRHLHLVMLTALGLPSHMTLHTFAGIYQRVLEVALGSSQFEKCNSQSFLDYEGHIHSLG